jgi:phosphoglycolate phosphatase-like HAD superfamily hydrolase
MRQLHRTFGGRIAMVTGRSQLAAEVSLKSLMKYFDLEACVFLEDEKREYAKPNPYAIRKAMEVMGAKNAVYSGDSAEDFLMAMRAEKETGARITASESRQLQKLSTSCLA